MSKKKINRCYQVYKTNIILEIKINFIKFLTKSNLSKMGNKIFLLWFS